ncbi:Uncharacterized 37.6 kDa protein in cld 5'region [Desulfamplus magnetovallimortis]|uniref:Uncharacterized 37.6 kDa protein in cld 5'region n=1 Tax=Desulfamplus magnetovallimortis TaxID=1246637 RepID=A0A1W1HC32_9BACT|nr:NAD-dependent epimerase/dehydratase family protein [Desulfamplus magnetovallimortis]SLM30003.1 Uncharacterized 37.6 kDa protein in cld 5'region [Desulfamplus magnetovallimortis]
MNFLVTGAAGFIGFFLSKALVQNGSMVTGIDNLNEYYDVNLKKSRLDLLNRHQNFIFHQIDIADRKAIKKLFFDNRFDVVINLAAQAGVRYSIDNPDIYIDANITGFANILEGCRHSTISHLIYASSSSVYGANKKIPFSIDDNVDHPVSLYAATKKSNELLAYSYSHLYRLPVTGLRFFTVYGPWGRPDMAYFKFTKAICEGKPIDVYNYGHMKRDFTYIDDIIKAIIKLTELPPSPSGSVESAFEPSPYALYNIGNNTPVELDVFIETLEEILEKKAVKNFLPMQAGDVPVTYADIDALTLKTGFRPETSIKDGLTHFVSWYKDYYC